MPKADTCFAGGISAWVAVNTHPHRELTAVENLVRQGFDTYCPMVRRRVRHARRTQDVLRPLFPTYLFVEVNLDVRQWRPILSTIGVRTLVRCGDELSFLDDGFIEALKSREVDGAIVRPENAYAIGQEVRIAGGPFDGLIARIVEMAERDRLVVLMDLLNQSVRVKVKAEGVSSA